MYPVFSFGGGGGGVTNLKNESRICLYVYCYVDEITLTSPEYVYSDDEIGVGCRYLSVEAP